MAENTYVEKVISDLKFASKPIVILDEDPEPSNNYAAYPEITRKFVEDPVFFAVLMCGDGWLNKAPNHQKLLQRPKPQASSCLRKRLGKKPRF